MPKISPIEKLRPFVDRDEETLGRLAAPLWARVGRDVGINDLSWAVAFGGDSVPTYVWEALSEVGALEGTPPRLRAPGLARLMAILTAAHEVASDDSFQREKSNKPTLIWTLPDIHPASSRIGRSYLSILSALIDNATQEILLVAPYVEASGIAYLGNPLANALGKGRHVTIITHGVADLASATSKSLEGFRRSAEHQPGTLSVYSAVEPLPLIHAKLAVIDSHSVVVGSANLTAPGLSGNVEAGVVLGASAAEEVLTVIRALVRVNQIALVFQSGGSEYRDTSRF
jgi:phosphatidylserine/phosphatidylglycerophosphate/cardiolipin synthase-like enzyme